MDLRDLLAGLAFRPGKNGPPLIGVSGAQGSGKTTLVRSVASRIGAVCLSLDDVYWPAYHRATLARQVHPLFATRGPPGTHDLPTLGHLLDRLAIAGPGDAIPLPAFDKLADDRLPQADWPVFRGAPTAILIDGWCLGATPQTAENLEKPVNALERDEDPDAIWRTAINAHLAGPYARLFSRFDGFLHLRAPGFEVVQAWREEQQAELVGRDLLQEEKVGLHRFIQHFERLTRHMLAGGVLPGVTVQLDAARAPVSHAVESR
ncbi:MAG: kinase [Caulobacter sp.]|nr:kinase [Caulobacter sp.]